MRDRVLSRAAALFAAALLVILAGCGNDDPTGPGGSSQPVAPETVNNFVQALPAWEAPDDTEDPPVLEEAEEEFNGSAYVRCETVRYDRKQNFDNLIAVGANATALKPGMLVQGRGVREGSLATIGLARSPLAISVDLALETPSRRIPNPSSSTIQDAVASLQREADTRLGNLDVIPAQISFQAKEAYSFEQAMLDAGISVKYSGVISSGSVGASIRQNTSSTSHTAVVKIFQPMYTISFADDEIAEPADFFADSVTEADFQRQVQLGTMGADNQPCYVQSVTFGRMVVYSATSSEVTSAEELKLALQASYGFWSGSANYDEQKASIVRNSSVEVQVFGGTQQDGTDAIRAALQSGEYGEFLRPVPATTAVPLSYRINDLRNRTAAIIGDATTYSIQSCREYTDMRFTVSLDRIEVVSGGGAEETFDIETWVDAGNQSYWLLHNSGSRFTREDLAAGGEQAIFMFSVTPGTFMEFSLGDYGNTATGREGWSGSRRIDYPFDFATVPYEFSLFWTTTDDSYRNTTLEAYFTIQRELVDVP
ncbi:MAG: thiol-activated cytolysin family protein [Candidatus Krumholzibacteriia bacterium]